MTEAQELLVRLEAMYDKRELQDKSEQALIDSILTPEIKMRIESIKAEYMAQNIGLAANIAETEKVLREIALQGCKPIKGEKWQVVWVKPRVTWDGKALESFAETYPQVLNFRKSGNPSTRISRR